jgi:hypothetical protein
LNAANFKLTLNFLRKLILTNNFQAKLGAMTGEQMIAIMSWVTDCEHRAANRYDDGRSTISALADQVMGVCTVERFKARQAFHLSPNDPDLDLDDFKRAVEVVEDERKNRPR